MSVSAMAVDNYGFRLIGLLDVVVVEVIALKDEFSRIWEFLLIDYWRLALELPDLEPLGIGFGSIFLFDFFEFLVATMEGKTVLALFHMSGAVDISSGAVFRIRLLSLHGRLSF
jgi:hypothetical protein